MKKTLHIIPGYKEPRSEYKDIESHALNKGWCVSYVPINWDLPLSKQTIQPHPNDMIFGFSLGAVVARLSYAKYHCGRMVLASCTPVYDLKKKELNNLPTKLAQDLMGMKLIRTGKDVVYLSGEREKLRGKKVKGAGHELTPLYVQTICRHIY